VRGRRNTVYDRFRGRIIFPIRDASGGATGLGGRILEPAGGPREGTPERDHGPKYLNSPATPLFDKSRSLYLVDRARGAMRKTGRAVIVEGYTDALMAHQAGFQNVVAGLGTALTAGQVELITRYAPSIALAYDVDPAGQSAGTFGATELTALIAEIQHSGARIGLTEVGVVRLPEGKDPDEVIRDDRAAWEAATAEPQPIMDYLVEYFAARHDPRTVGGRKRLVDAVVPTLRRIGDPVERGAYVQSLARRSGVDERTILEVLRQHEAAARTDAARHDGGRAGHDDPSATGHGSGRFTAEAVLAARDGVDDPAEAVRVLDQIERELLTLLLRHSELRAGRTDLKPETLLTTPARELWRALLAADEAARAADPTAWGVGLEPFVGSLDADVGLIARGLLLRGGPVLSQERASRAIDQCLVNLARRHVDEELEFLRADLAEAEARHDTASREARREPAALEALHDRIRTLQRERAELDRRAAASTMLTRTSTTAVGGPA
jgi:DNA primase